MLYGKISQVPINYWKNVDSFVSPSPHLFHQVSSPRPNVCLLVSFQQPVLLCLMCSFPVFLSVLWFPGNMHQILYFLSICPCTYSTAFIYYFLEYHWSQLPCLLSYFVFSSFYSAHASTVQVWHCKASTSPRLLLTTVESTSLKPALSSSN